MADGGENGLGVQHAGAEVGELGRLRERQLGDGARRGCDLGIGRQHAAHVGPDLDLARAERGPDQRRAVVRAAAPQRSRHPFRGRADVAAEHRDLARGEQRLERRARGAVGLRQQRLGLAGAGVGDDAAASIHLAGRDAAHRERRGHQARRQAFALGGHGVGRRGVARHPREIGGQLAPGGGQQGVVRVAARLSQQATGSLGVPGEDGLQLFERPGGVVLAGACRRREQGVGDPGHRRDDHDGMLGQGGAHDRDGAFDGGGVLDRGAAELHDDRVGHPRWSGTLPASISRMPPSELNTPVASYGM